MAASVIGCANQRRRDAMVPSCRSEGQGRGLAVSLLLRKREVTPPFRLPSMHRCRCSETRVALFGHSSAPLSVRTAMQVCSCDVYDANLPSGFPSYLVSLPHYLLCSFREDSPLTSISRAAFRSRGAIINVIH